MQVSRITNSQTDRQIDKPDDYYWPRPRLRVKKGVDLQRGQTAASGSVYSFALFC